MIMTREEELINHIKEYLDSGMWKYEACYLGKEDLEIIIKALEQKTEWIPVSERLPEDGTWNIFTNDKNISIERYKNDALDHFFPSGRWFSLEDAVAWMPLPEQYKESE